MNASKFVGKRLTSRPVIGEMAFYATLLAALIWNWW